MSTTNPTTASKTTSKEDIIIFVILLVLGVLSAIVLLNKTDNKVVQQVKATKTVVKPKPVAKPKPKPKTNAMLTYEEFKKEYEAKEAKAKAEAEALAEAKAKAKAKAMREAKEAKAKAKAMREAKRLSLINKKCWKRIIKKAVTLTADEPTKLEYEMTSQHCRSISFIYSESVEVFGYDELNISRYKYTIVKVENNKIKVIKLNKKEKKEKAEAIAKTKKIAKLKEEIKRNEEKLMKDIRKSYLKKLMLERKLKATK